jgi:NAD+ synthetase
VKVYLAQIDTTVGDIEGNLARILRSALEARARGADLAVFPELAITGYPPRDLLEKGAFVRANLSALERAARAAEGLALIVGYVEPNASGTGNGLYNAAAWCEGGRVVRTVRKRFLPTYDVFDEVRHFEPGGEAQPAPADGHRVGVSICEDAWTDPAFFGRRKYEGDPIAEQARAGADLIVNISAGPFALGRPAYRDRLFGGHAARHRVPLIYVNLVGGNDELLFDGRSAVFDAQGRKVVELAAFREDAALVDTDRLGAPLAPREEDDAEEALEALVMGTRDYTRKCSFTRAVIGLSGGIDSSVVAAIAARALGPASVTGVWMPSRYSSAESAEDAAALAANLGIERLTLSIEGPFAAYLDALAEPFRGRAPDVTEENIQARIRGNYLMALSNKFGWLVLTTGNKSETAVGYSTLYGDMSGGLAVISDVPKTLVYEVGRRLNRERAVIPERVFTKAPSAELRPGQRDQDSLPPYELLDGILRLYVEELRSAREIVAAGYDAEVVREIIRRVDRSEYKRWQAPPGLRITTKAFGLGRRMPIAQKWTES